jgi:hypothetical protein
VEEAISPDREINEGSLNGGFKINHPPLVDIACVCFVTASLDVKLFQHAIFNNGDPAFLRLEDVDQHFFLHNRMSPDEAHEPPPEADRQLSLAIQSSSWVEARGLFLLVFASLKLFFPGPGIVFQKTQQAGRQNQNNQ